MIIDKDLNIKSKLDEVTILQNKDNVVIIDDMENVKEYGEGYEVSIVLTRTGYDKEDGHRLTIDAVNQGGHDSTSIDMIQLLQWFENKNICKINYEELYNMLKPIYETEIQGKRCLTKF